MSAPLLFRLTAYLAFALCAALLIAPGLFSAIFGLDASTGGEVMARRAGVLFAPIGLIYLQLGASGNQQVRRALWSAGTLLMIAMALLGLTELILGRAGPGILVAVSVEVILAALYLKVTRDA